MTGASFRAGLLDRFIDRLIERVGRTVNASANHRNRILSVGQNFLHEPFDASASRDLGRDWQRIFLRHVSDAFAGGQDDPERFAG